MPATTSAILTGEACDPPGRFVRFREHMQDQVDEERCVPLLAGYCAVTGYLDSISISVFSVWCGFQTGNFTTLAIFVTDFLSERSLAKPIYSQYTAIHALFALVSFCLGAFCARLGDSSRNTTCKSRAWLFSCGIVQTILCGIATLVVFQGHQFYQLYAVAGLSASLGLQGVNAKRLNSQLSTTVVLTALCCDLMTDKELFALPFRQRAKLRDEKLLGLFCLFAGAVLGRVLLQSKGTTGALIVGTGFRLLIAVGWMFVPAKKRVFLT